MKEGSRNPGNGEESRDEVGPSGTANALSGIFSVLFVGFVFCKEVIA